MSDLSTEKSPRAGLERRLGLFDAAMMMIGIVVGSGIFLTTGIMAQSLPSAGLILVAWLVGGIIVFTGAVTYAELGAALPRAGGHYVYLKEAFGPIFGFLFGWKMFLVSMGGAIAALAVAFAEYLGCFFPVLSTDRVLIGWDAHLLGISFSHHISAGQIAAICAIVLLSAINYAGVSFGKIIQNALTVVKILTLLAIVCAGAFIANPNPIDFTLGLSDRPWSLGSVSAGFGLALIAVFWAYDGWNNINYIAGEITNPKRNLVAALTFGSLAITVLYCLVNVTYVRALSVDEMAGVVRVAQKAFTSLYGPTATGFLSAAVLVSVFGALNGAIFVGPRVYYAMALDDLFFKRVGQVHPRFKTPAFSILIQAIWAGLLTLSGTFEQLFTFATFVSILFWVLAAASIFALRVKRPDLPRPYRAFGYPWIPLVFVCALCGVLTSTVVQKPVESLAGLGLLGLGVPVYYLWRRSSKC